MCSVTAALRRSPGGAAVRMKRSRSIAHGPYHSPLSGASERRRSLEARDARRLAHLPGFSGSLHPRAAAFGRYGLTASDGDGAGLLSVAAALACVLWPSWEFRRDGIRRHVRASRALRWTPVRRLRPWRRGLPGRTDADSTHRAPSRTGGARTHPLRGPIREGARRAPRDHPCRPEWSVTNPDVARHDVRVARARDGGHPRRPVRCGARCPRRFAFPAASPTPSPPPASPPPVSPARTGSHLPPDSRAKPSLHSTQFEPILALGAMGSRACSAPLRWEPRGSSAFSRAGSARPSAPSGCRPHLPPRPRRGARKPDRGHSASLLRTGARFALSYRCVLGRVRRRTRRGSPRLHTKRRTPSSIVRDPGGNAEPCGRGRSAGSSASARFCLSVATTFA